MNKNYTLTKIACYIGYIVQAIACSFISLIFVILQNTYNIGYEKLGRLILICFVTQLLVDVLSIRITRIFGYRKMIVAAQIFAALGFISLSILPKIIPAYSGITISVILYSVGSGLIEVIISPVIEYLPTKNKSGNMALLHSFFCWGNVLVIAITTIMIHILGQNSWGIISIFWSVIPIIDLFLFSFVPIIEPKKTQTKDSVRAFLSTPKFYIMLLLMLFAGASEIGVSNWMSAFTEQALGLPKLLGDLVGPCLFAICMGLGRVVFSFKGDKLSMKKILLVLSFLTAVSYLVLALSKNAALSLVFGVFIGFCVSVMWPGVLSLSAHNFPFGATAMFGLLAMCGDFGCSVGPWVIGAIADERSLNAGFLVTSIFPILMFITMVILNIRKKEKKE